MLGIGISTLLSKSLEGRGMQVDPYLQVLDSIRICESNFRTLCGTRSHASVLIQLWIKRKMAMKFGYRFEDAGYELSFFYRS